METREQLYRVISTDIDFTISYYIDCTSLQRNLEDYILCCNIQILNNVTVSNRLLFLQQIGNGGNQIALFVLRCLDLNILFQSIP